MDEVLVERRGPICIVTLNRPKVFNALSSTLCHQLIAAWKAINADPEIRVAVLTGAGGNFTAGGDLKEMAALAGDASDTRPFLEKVGYMLDSLLRNYVLDVPLIAAVEGVALAGGMEILQATHIRIAGESARFGLPEVRNGIGPFGSTVRLVRQISYTKAAELLLTGKSITAAEAKEIGLIGSVVPDGEALAHALEVAQRIADNAPLAVRAILRSMRSSAGVDDEAALAAELAIGAPVFDSADAEEGLRAFVERRTPRFTGA